MYLIKVAKTLEALALVYQSDVERVRILMKGSYGNAGFLVLRFKNNLTLAELSK